MIDDLEKLKTDLEQFRTGLLWREVAAALSEEQGRQPKFQTGSVSGAVFLAYGPARNWP